MRRKCEERGVLTQKIRSREIVGHVIAALCESLNQSGMSLFRMIELTVKVVRDGPGDRFTQGREQEDRVVEETQASASQSVQLFVVRKDPWLPFEVPVRSGS